MGQGRRPGRDFYGQTEVSRNIRNIKRLSYDHDVHVSQEVVSRILDCDLIILSPGSLYTSILPHLIAEEVVEAIGKARAPILYVCNLVTQPGETDGYQVSDHLREINRYLQGRKVDLVLANNARIDQQVKDVYRATEAKTVVELDREKVEAMKARIIEDEIFCLDESGSIRHDPLKTAFLIFSYLMGK